jgi:hypothetical protein
MTTERRTHPRVTDALSKVPQVTLAFWVIKILATTLGETGGDALSMTLKLGYAVSTLIFLGLFIVTLAPRSQRNGTTRSCTGRSWSPPRRSARRCRTTSTGPSSSDT